MFESNYYLTRTLGLYIAREAMNTFDMWLCKSPTLQFLFVKLNYADLFY